MGAPRSAEMGRPRRDAPTISRQSDGLTMTPKRLLSAALLLAVFVLVCSGRTRTPSRASVVVITDEADAVLSILAKRRANQQITDADWQRLFATEGYVRLKKREASMRRTFEDQDFKSFVLTDALLERGPLLADTLTRWKSADATRAANLALAYLPKQARIKAKIYPVIKPRDNSFVFELQTDPAIFLFLDPAMSKEKFENHLAHELHHVGFGTACPNRRAADAVKLLPKNVRTVMTYLGAFGEGFAMLAAAGGPNVHPHAVGNAADRARWDRDVANFNHDFSTVEKFFLDVLGNRLSEQQINEAVSAFFGEQGAWYTVGWRMCVLIEKTYGRRALIDVMCDQRKLLPTYNRAAARFNRRARPGLTLWSPELIAAVGKATSDKRFASPFG